MPKRNRGKSSSNASNETPDASPSASESVVSTEPAATEPLLPPPPTVTASGESPTSALKEQTPATATPPKQARPLIAQQSAPVATTQPRQAHPLRRPPRDEPREWFARLRIREDRLARLWVANLTSRDVVVWSPKEKRWVALLGVPELRAALKIAEQERANNPRSVVSRPPSIPPARLSQPPTTLPPSPPPRVPRTTSVSIAGELKLLSIAQGSARGTTEVSRATLPPPASSSPSQRRINDAWAEHFARRSLAPSSRFSSWQWKAIERVLWVAAGVGVVLALSSAGATDEASSRFQPASYVLGAELNGETFAPRTNADGFVQWWKEPNQQSSTETPRCRPVAKATEDSETDGATTHRTATTDGVPAASPKVRAKAPALPGNVVEPATDTVQGPQDFDLASARMALIHAAAVARSCPGSSIQGKAIVTFDPSGVARAVDIPLLIGDSVDRDCIARSFKTVHVPRFTGGSVAVKKDF